MDDTDSTVLHAIDRTLTDMLPDKHLYEPDLQLYLDYSLPPHPELAFLEGSEEDDADDAAQDVATLSEVLFSRSDPSWEEALQQTITEQFPVLTEGSDDSTHQTEEARPYSAQTVFEALGEMGAHESSSIAADQDHEPSDSGEGVGNSNTYLWPDLAHPLSNASILLPEMQPDYTASHDSRAAIQQCSGCEENLQQLPEPHDNEQNEPPLKTGYDAGHLMPLTAGEALELCLAAFSAGPGCMLLQDSQLCMSGPSNPFARSCQGPAVLCRRPRQGRRDGEKDANAGSVHPEDGECLPGGCFGHTHE